ncbi:hypothetical protein YC2023_010388 [Brassica napus]
MCQRYKVSLLLLTCGNGLNCGFGGKNFRFRPLKTGEKNLTTVRKNLLLQSLNVVDDSISLLGDDKHQVITNTSSIKATSTPNNFLHPRTIS